MLEHGAGEPANGADFKRLAAMHTFGDVGRAAACRV
jgi:hypothetical protein